MTEMLHSHKCLRSDGTHEQCGVAALSVLRQVANKQKWEEYTPMHLKITVC